MHWIQNLRQRLFRNKRSSVASLVIAFTLLGLLTYGVVSQIKSTNNYLLGSQADSAEPLNLIKGDLHRLSEVNQQVISVLREHSRHEDTIQTVSQFQQYQSLLEEAQLPCNQVLERYNAVSVERLPDDQADKLSNSRRLCEDAIAVYDYAADVADALVPYISFDEAVDLDENRLKELMGTTNEAISRLEAIEAPAIEDPGRQEIIYQLKRTKDEVGTTEDNQTTNTSALQEQIKQDKQNFLNARTYYWRNTVMIQRLQHAIDRISAEI